MKVIFLDVDGVLNSVEFANEYCPNYPNHIFAEDILDKRAIEQLRILVDNCGGSDNVIIVLSSTWRRIPSAKQNLVRQLAEFGLCLHSSTPTTRYSRGWDITQWMREHPEIEIESYVILDDDADMDEHIAHLVQTKFYERGLTQEHREMAERMLGIEF